MKSKGAQLADLFGSYILKAETSYMEALKAGAEFGELKKIKLRINFFKDLLESSVIKFMQDEQLKIKILETQLVRKELEFTKIVQSNRSTGTLHKVEKDLDELRKKLKFLRNVPA